MFNKYKDIIASGQVKAGAGVLTGVIINSHTAGTLKLWDALTATTPVICNTMSFAVGERFIPLYDIAFTTGLYATIGGTADITIVYE